MARDDRMPFRGNRERRDVVRSACRASWPMGSPPVGMASSRAMISRGSCAVKLSRDRREEKERLVGLGMPPILT
jgi:hypothetical protein